MRPDPLRGDWLRRAVAPAQLRLFARLGSTNATAVRLLEARRLAPPAIVAASQQTAGRGQRANRWWSDAGTVCATFVLPTAPDRPPGHVPLCAGLAVAAVAERHLGGGEVRVKWPNDVLVGRRKLAGILCQRLAGADVIGIGLNVRTSFARAPAEVRRRATSLAREGAVAPRRDEVIAELWHALAAALADAGWRERFHALHALQGRDVRIECDGSIRAGRCDGIDAEGRLLLEEPGAPRIALTAGIVLDYA